MGSAADLKYSKELESIAFETGKLIAKGGNIVLYGAEKDCDSLSTAAARGAKSVGGLAIGVTYGKGKGVWEKGLADAVICSGMERGGGREFVLVNSCDAIIIVSGGSGTLNEVAVAYQLNIPVIAINGTGGWADKLAGTYLDERKKAVVIRADNPEEAVQCAVNILVKDNC